MIHFVGLLKDKMAQAHVNHQGYFKWIEFPLDEEQYVWVGRKKDQPLIGIYKKNSNRRTGIQMTPEQFQRLQEMMESIQIALSLVAPTFPPFHIIPPSPPPPTPPSLIGGDIFSEFD